MEDLSAVGALEGRSEPDRGTSWHVTKNDPRLVDDRVVLDGVIQRDRRINQLEAERAEWVAEMDRRRAYRLDAARTAASWLRHHCHKTPGEARRMVRVARALVHIAVAAKHFVTGELDQYRMRHLAAAHHDHPDVFSRDEQLLVDHALTLSANDFARTLRYWHWVTGAKPPTTKPNTPP